ncbi:hypothetical protein ABZR37_13305 [Achromobacter ruhlandii]|uniref:hypothetical protein n=1 Tax=Achromobacter ruhlandii TaxID=72557 RepID=UPI003556CF48
MGQIYSDAVGQYYIGADSELMLAPLILAKKDLKLTGDLKFEGGATITLNYL